MSKITNVTDSNWENEVFGADGLVMVDFWADWCGPCKMIAPVVEEISEERDDVKVCKLNVDENPGTAQKYQISAIPTMIFFKDGKKVEQMVGFRGKEGIVEIIQSNN